MSKITYTKSQETAIQYKGGNLLLSAAAGSGKTATLTARILRLLLEGDENGEVNLTDMLVVTYTRAAASELRGRISAAILDAEREWRTPHEGEGKPMISGNRFFRHITDVQRADISTIHSFLYKVLRPYFAALGLSPDMSIIDESASNVLKSAAMQDTIDDYFERGSPRGQLSALQQPGNEDNPRPWREGTDKNVEKRGSPRGQLSALQQPANEDYPRPWREGADKNVEKRGSPRGQVSDTKASFFELADALGTARDASALDAVLVDMADSLVSAGKDETCLYSYADVLDIDAENGFFKSVYGEYIKDHIRLMLRHYRTVFADISDDFFAGGGGKLAEKYGSALTDMINVILRTEDAIENGDYSAVREIIAGYTPVALGRITAKDKTEMSEYFKTVRDRFKKDMADLAESYFTADEEELALSMHRTARILRKLGDVLGTYYKAFAKRKRMQNALDYADLEIYALKLFLDENGDPTDAAREVGERYKYIFVDEYQDTNHVQDDIFRAISGKSVRFMVGDIKQSIYRFRGAEPEVFSGYRDKWPVLRNAVSEEGLSSDIPAEFSPDDGRCVFMSENFRCDEPVVRFVNMISGYMFPFGGIPYTTDDGLICGKGKSDAVQNPVEICLIEKPRRKKSDEEEGAPVWDDDFNPEAEYVADRIAAMLGSFLIDGERPCRASDVAIITRNLKGTAEVYGEALMRRGIQVRLKTSVTPMSAKSAKLVMCILNLVDNPLREIYAAGAMRSPVFGFTTDDIVALKRYGGDLPLYMAVTRAAAYYDKTEDFGYAYVPEPMEAGEENPLTEQLPGPEKTAEDENFAENISPALGEKCVNLARWVRRHKTIVRGMKADKYIEFLYNELDLSALPEIFRDAAERNALNRLYESARRYESGRFGGLSGFIEYMNENADTETAEVGEENAVSIVSIHASKGLEYPVCFLVECGKERNKADERKNLLFDTVLGFGMTLPDEGGLVRCDTAVRCGIAEKKRGDAINEEMRILYVAMTRARSKLIVTAKTADAEALLTHAEREKDYFTEWSVRECAAYRDIIINAAAGFGPADFYETKVIGLEQIHPYLPGEILGMEVGDPAEPLEMTESDEGEEVPEIDFEENFNFRYPLEFLSKIPSKLAVSGLSPHILDDEENMDTIQLSFDPPEPEEPPEEERAAEQNVPLPSFMTGITEVKGADRGIATHVFMQFMDLERLRTGGVDAELARLVRERFISPQTAELVNKTHLKRFAESELFFRMCSAEMIRREFRFNVLMPAEKFTTDEALAEKLRENGIKVTVQGVVDCVFRGENGLVLVDYKTDAMTREEFKSPRLGEEKLIRRHKNQLMYYKEICARLFGEEIAETVIYSTTLGRAVKL